MKYLRLTYILFVILLVTSLLAGCTQPTQAPAEETEAPSEQMTEEPEEPAEVEDVTIRFMTAETDPPSVEAYEKIIAAYEEQNPGVTISLELINPDDLNTKLPASLAVGEPPHIAQCDQYIVPEFVAEGHLVPVDDAIEAAGGRDAFYPGSLLDINGNVYNVPYAGFGTVWWYRTDLFEEHGIDIPTTAEELVAAAEELTMDTDGDGQTDIYGIAFPAGSNAYTSHILTTAMHQHGQNMFDAELNPTVNNQATIDALTLLGQLAEFAPPGIGSYSYYDVIDAFAAEKVAITPYPGRLLSHVQANNPDLLEVTAAMPLVLGNANDVTFGGWDSYCVYEAAGHNDIAKDFAFFLTTGDMAAEFLVTVPGHLLPPLLSMQDSPVLWENELFISHEADMRTIFTAAETSLNIGNEAGSIDADGNLTDRRVLNPIAATVLARQTMATASQKVVLEGEDPADVAAWAQSELEAIVAEAGGMEIVEQPTEAPVEDVTIRFMTAETDPPSVEAYEKIIAAFEEENPGVTISLELINPDDLNTKLPASLAVGEPPHIAQCDQYIVPEFVAEGHLVSVDTAIEAAGGREAFYPGSLLDIDGNVYNVPYAGFGTVWWYRTDLFEENGIEIPTTAEELVAAAEKLTMDTNGDGQTDIYGIAFPAGSNAYTSHILTTAMHQHGQNLFDADLNPTVDNQAMIDSLGLLGQLAEFAPPGIGSYSYYDVIDAFAAEKVAITPYPGRLLSHVQANNPDLLEVTAAMPLVLGNENNVTFGGWDSYCVYEAAGHNDIAMKFAFFLTTGEMAGEFLVTVPGHLLPPLLSMQESPVLWENELFISHEEDMRTIFTAAETSLNIGNEAGSIDADGNLTESRVLNPIAATVLARQTFATAVQMVVLEGQSPEEVAAWAQAELEAIIAESGG
jgi:multiple sugar transport system substrate-binding protein